MTSRLGILLLVALFATAAPAQFERTATVSGTTFAGTAFDLAITNASLTRTIAFAAMPVDYSAPAMAALMVRMINDDYRRNGNTGFQARAANKADGVLEIDSSFVILSSTKVSEIAIGPPGGVGTAPRAPGISFNPFFIDQENETLGFYPGAQPGHPNARLMLNGQDPATTIFRKVEVLVDPVTGAQLDLEISSGPNANAGILLLIGPYGDGVTAPINGTLLTTWGDVLDIGTPNPAPGGLPLGLGVVADGIFMSAPSPLNPLFVTDVNGNFSISHVLPASVAPFEGDGFQAIVTDPTAPAGLRVTQAVHPVYRIGRERQIPVGTDGLAPVDFLPGLSFDFYGQVGQTQVFAYENGLLSFGPAPTLFGANAAVDPQAALAGNAAILANWSNWQIQPGGALRVYEFGDEIRIGWGFDGLLGHAGDTDLAVFECSLRLFSGTGVLSPGAGAVRLDWLDLDPQAADQNDAVVGISPGFGLDPAPLNRDLGVPSFGAFADGALLMQADAAGGAASSLPTSMAGVASLYDNGSGWSGRALTFLPPSPNGVLAGLPFAIPSDARPDDLRGVLSGADQISASGGPGQSLGLVGYFLYAHDAAGLPQISVVLDPAGAVLSPVQLALGPLAAAPGTPFLPGGVATFPPPPGFRSFEFLQVIAPDPAVFVPPSTTLPAVVDLEVQFADGTAVLLPGAVTIVP